MEGGSGSSALCSTWYKISVLREQQASLGASCTSWLLRTYRGRDAFSRPSPASQEAKRRGAELRGATNDPHGQQARLAESRVLGADLDAKATYLANATSTPIADGASGALQLLCLADSSRCGRCGRHAWADLHASDSRYGLDSSRLHGTIAVMCATVVFVFRTATLSSRCKRCTSARAAPRAADCGEIRLSFAQSCITLPGYWGGLDHRAKHMACTRAKRSTR